MTTTFVYYNLHKRVWSLRERGRVVAHAPTLYIAGRCKVSQAGRERVLREGRKNVHAGIVGEVLSVGPAVEDATTLRECTYNPYKFTSFVYKDTLEPVEGEHVFLMDNRRVFVCL